MLQSLKGTRTKHTAAGKVTESRRRTTMSDACMIDPFDECFHDCPNCPRAVDADAETDWDSLAEEDDDDSL